MKYLAVIASLLIVFWPKRHQHSPAHHCRCCMQRVVQEEAGVCEACRYVLLLGDTRADWILAGIEDDMMENPRAWLPIGWQFDAGTKTLRMPGK